jgi:hypothetical protein
MDEPFGTNLYKNYLLGGCAYFLAFSDYLPSHSSPTQVHHNLPISHLIFMDDSTLIASSKAGIEDRLSITYYIYIYI